MAQMLLSQSGNLILFPQHKIRARKDLSGELHVVWHRDIHEFHFPNAAYAIIVLISLTIYRSLSFFFQFLQQRCVPTRGK